MMFIVFAAVTLVRALADDGDEGPPGSVTELVDSTATDTDSSESTSTETTSTERPAPTTGTETSSSETTGTGASNGSTTISSTIGEPVEVLPTDPTAPVVDAAAYAVYDMTGDEWMSTTNADAQRPVGSLIKLLTAYVVMQAGDPTKVVTVPELDLNIAESQIGLFAGEQLQRDTLLRAMLIVSANDAAKALAVDVGGSEAQFVTMMNEPPTSSGSTAPPLPTRRGSTPRAPDRRHAT